MYLSSFDKAILSLIGACIGVIVLLIMGISSWEEGARKEAFQQYNQYAKESGAKLLSPEDAEMMDASDIRDLLLQLKYGAHPSRKQYVPMYIYTGS